MFHRVNAVTIAGTYYCKNACVVASVDDQDFPEFYRISAFIITPPPTTQVAFVCEQLVTEHYLAHYHAYAVRTTDIVKIVRQQDLYDFHPFHPLQCVTLPETRTSNHTKISHVLVLIEVVHTN